MALGLLRVLAMSGEWFTDAKKNVLLAKEKAGGTEKMAQEAHLKD